jgi:hypothetical protein
MPVDERTEALCKYEAAKKDLQQVGMKAAYYLQEIRKETNTLLLNKDFLSLNLKKCQSDLEELKQLQIEGNRILSLITELNSVYKFD